MLHSFRLFSSSAALIVGLALSGAAAWAETGSDHPEVARYPGSEIKVYVFREYEEAQMILSRPHRRDGKWVADKLLPVEGRVTYVHYQAPQESSGLQVFRNYQSVLKRSGFTELFVCERPCIDDNISVTKELMKARDLYFNGHQDPQYLVYQRGNTYVSLWVTSWSAGPEAWLYVVEKQKLDDGLMAVSGDSAIAKALSTDGKIDLYGFLFDSGKSALRDGSKPTLAELGKVLQDNPTLNIEVIGHTDDVGGPESNQKLSDARARAVVDALVAGAGLTPARAQAKGMGQTQPLAPNTSEAGRAKNRRVEIVAMVVANPVAASVPSAKVPAAAPVPVARPNAPEVPVAQAPQAPQATKPAPSLINEANAVIDTAAKIFNLFK